MRNNFLSSSLNSVVSLDMDSSWAARTWGETYWNQNMSQVPYRKSNSSSLLSEQDPVWPTSLSQGKVRQLFLERRGGKGWDRSYPLEPLKNKRNANTERNIEQQTKSPPNLSETYTDLSQTLPDRAYFYKKLPNIGGTMQSKTAETASAKKRISRIPQPKVNERLKSPTVAITKDIKKLGISLQKPLGDDTPIKSRSTEIRKPATPQKKDEEKSRPLHKTANESKNTTPDTQISNKVRTPINLPARSEKTNSNSLPINSSAKSEKSNSNSLPEKVKTNSNSLPEKVKTNSNSLPEKVKVQRNSNPDMPQCSICGRSFAPDRIELHEKICKKTKTKKRKTFDPTKQRLAGTEAESYLKKGPTQQKSAPVVTPSKSDWRKKHEEFIANIRAAKQVKAHLAKGGKLSDLPPPPPLDTSDYHQCPHCGRKFNQAAAERHIPICANMKHNKPKKVNKK